MDILMIFALFTFLVVELVLLIVILVFLLKRKDTKNSELSDLRQEICNTTINSISTMGSSISRNQSDKMEILENRFKTFSEENERKLESIRCSVEDRLEIIQRENNEKLEKMRETVDEKLQNTLEIKINESFKRVNEQLESVYKGLGEMQSIASGVGDIKKVLSNVKSRGILGEVQLSAILKDILTCDQYDENVITKQGSSDRVEFAVKLPAYDDGYIYLPIDSKFPGDSYNKLRDAYDSGDKNLVESAWKLLRTTIKSEAKDISKKYLDVPNTTEFAIMFLPFEGLYSEVVNRGMIEELQRDYKINIAGPSTMAAILNSIQMGFKTLAVQKQSAKAWKVLGAVKKEFETFSSTFEDSQTRLNQAQEDLDKLVGTRTRMIRSKLKSVEVFDAPLEKIDEFE